MVPIPRRSRITNLFNEQAGKCHYCETEMTLSLGFNRTATVDHVVPRSKGGADTNDNIVAACYDCNQKKGNMPVEKFLRLLAAAR